MKNKKEKFHIAIIGPANAGKSTLINRLLKEHTSIVSWRPQTTRNQVSGVTLHHGNEIVFSDTPGFQIRKKNKLSVAMNQAIITSVNQADIILYVVEALKWDAKDINRMKKITLDKEVVLIVNKIDKLKDKNLLLPFIEQANLNFPFKDSFLISALKSKKLDFLDVVIGSISNDCQISVHQARKQEIKFLLADYIREQIFINLNDEVPYKSYVLIEEIEESARITRIKALIGVDKINQKAIIIGKKGYMLKKIVSNARLSMEKKLKKKVFLSVWVKVESGWDNSISKLGLMGF